MKAVCWYGTRDVRVESVPDPEIVSPRDAIVRVTSTAICGSDVHLYHGMVPTMRKGDILGHEFMGEVVEVGSGVEGLQIGARVVVPFPIACGACWFCKSDLWSLCDNTNPNGALGDTFFGHAPAGIFGYSHLMGGYAGGQAEYVRVPFADVGPMVVEGDLSDEQVLFLSDILPTGWMAAEQGEVKDGDVVAVWGCGPVGLFAIKAASLLGAERVVAIDRFPERMELARRFGAADVVDYTNEGILEALRDITAGRGPDVCIDAVGMEAHGHGVLATYDWAKQAVMAQTDRPTVLRQVLYACRKGGIVSLAGVYGGVADKLPLGAAFNKGIAIRMGQTHVHRYMRPLLKRIEAGEIDPPAIVSHRVPLDDAPDAYAMFAKKEDDCTKVVLRPAA